MARFWRIFSPWPVLSLLLAVCPPAWAARPYVDGVSLSRGPRADLVVSFHVEQTLVPQLVDTLESGLPVRFTFWIRVDHPRPWARDYVLADLRFERVLEKENLEDRYRITFEDGRTVRTESDLAKAVRMMGRVEGVSLLPLAALAGPRPIFLRIKVRVQEFKLPFRLHRLLPFVSFWDVETDWYVLEIPRVLP